MVLLLLEALLALLILVAIVWWTMFSGRQKGELHREAKADDAQPASQGQQEAQQHAKGSATATPSADKR